MPDEISAWNPERAPHAMVMKRNGKSLPANTGPSPDDANGVTASVESTGFASTRPTASSTITPTFMKVDR
ncbi:hypothetical protein QE366_002866 [Nocardioides zeae]|nr:hypothetical protein [Nocardioides zeae]